MSAFVEIGRAQAPSDTTIKNIQQLPFLQSPSSVTVQSNHESLQSTTLTLLPFEMLEAVLLYLPPRDLLLSQRICRRFRQVVCTSNRIQRTLFFEHEHYSGKLETWKLLKWNPFLESRLSSLLNIRVIGVHRGVEGTVKMVAHARYREDALLDPDRLEVCLCDQASWKQMLVTQPPATLLMHPSASLFWKSSMEDQAQFFHDPAGFTILDTILSVNW